MTKRTLKRWSPLDWFWGVPRDAADCGQLFACPFPSLQQHCRKGSRIYADTVPPSARLEILPCASVTHVFSSWRLLCVHPAWWLPLLHAWLPMQSDTGADCCHQPWCSQKPCPGHGGEETEVPVPSTPSPSPPDSVFRGTLSRLRCLCGIKSKRVMGSWGFCLMLFSCLRWTWPITEMGLNSWKESQPFLSFPHTLILWIIALFSFHSNELSATDTVIQRNRNTNRWVIDPHAFITPEFSFAVRAINSFICHSEIPGPFTRKVKQAGLPPKRLLRVIVISALCMADADWVWQAGLTR